MLKVGLCRSTGAVPALFLALPLVVLPPPPPPPPFAATGKGVEIGVYQLLINARSATALDQCAPNNAGSLPNAGYDCMDPTTQRTCKNGDQATCAGGPGCCSMCGASEFYDEMEASMMGFWNATGITGMEQDGAESWQVRLPTRVLHFTPRSPLFRFPIHALSLTALRKRISRPPPRVGRLDLGAVATGA
jgi:hypothetical protein